ncbi:MAG: tetratricopeptide repeat protein [Prevotellaceae bacterium]|jgi:tetratricopeptide (TPR) repeat protein|nr:tetratricopeptide repeat protein [Prevotellaceae bacterium]
MSVNKNYIQQSKQLAKQYENNKHHYFELDEFIAISDYYMLNDNYENALEVNSAAEIFYPSSFELKIIRVDMYIRNNELENAEKTIKTIEYDSNLISDISILKGEICIKRNQYESAEKLFDDAVKLSEDKEFTFDMICDFLMLTNQVQLAKKYLELAQNTLTDVNPDLMYKLARCYEYDAEYQKSAEIYEKMIKNDPFDENIWNELGYTYMFLSEYEKAIKAFNFRLAINNENATEVLINKAECISILGRNDEAINIYNKILNTEKENTEALFGIAKCYERKGIYDTAEKIYLEIVSLNSDYKDAYFSIAGIYLKKNQFATAEQFMQKALDDNEIVPGFVLQMCKIQFEQDKIEEAKQTIEKIIFTDLCKHDSHAWILYSELIAVDDVEKAINILEAKYNENFYSIGEVCYHLAYYNYIINNMSQCAYYVERALEIDSDMMKSFIEICPAIMLNEHIMSLYMSFKSKK